MYLFHKVVYYGPQVLIWKKMRFWAGW